MRHSLPVFVIAVLVAGCQRSVEQDLPIAATPAVLDCARRAAVQYGYQPAQQPSKDGTPRLVRNLFGRGGDPPQEGSPRDWSIQDYLTITEARGNLRIAAVGATIEGKERAPSPRTLDDVKKMAAAIAAQCAGS